MFQSVKHALVNAGVGAHQDAVIEAIEDSEDVEIEAEYDSKAIHEKKERRNKKSAMKKMKPPSSTKDRPAVSSSESTPDDADMKWAKQQARSRKALKGPDEVRVMKAVADEAEDSEEMSEVGIVASRVGVSAGHPQPKQDNQGRWRVPKSWGADNKGRDTRTRSQPPAQDGSSSAAADRWEPKRASVSQRASSVGDTPSSYRGRADRPHKPPPATWVPVPERVKSAASSSAGPSTDTPIPRGSVGKGQLHLQRGTGVASNIDPKISAFYATDVAVNNENPWEGPAASGGYTMVIPHLG